LLIDDQSMLLITSANVCSCWSQSFNIKNQELIRFSPV